MRKLKNEVIEEIANLPNFGNFDLVVIDCIQSVYYDTHYVYDGITSNLWPAIKKDTGLIAIIREMSVCGILNYDLFFQNTAQGSSTEKAREYANALLQKRLSTALPCLSDSQIRKDKLALMTCLCQSFCLHGQIVLNITEHPEVAEAIFKQAGCIVSSFDSNRLEHEDSEG